MAKPWYNNSLNYFIAGFPDSCSLNVVHGIYLNDPTIWDQHTPTQRAVSSEVRRMTQELKSKNQRVSYLLTITDDIKNEWKLWDKALRTNKWKRMMKSPTSHLENYNVYTYGLVNTWTK